MDTKTLYKHKAVYIELQKKLEEHENLPQLSKIANQINHILAVCKNYEEWGVNSYDWECRVNKFCDAGFVTISSYSEDRKKKQILGTDREYFFISFHEGAFLFGNEYYYDLFCEFFDKLVEITKPFYVDELNHELYYTEETACKANDAVEPLYKEYEEKYLQLEKEKHIKKLKAQLAEMEKQDD